MNRLWALALLLAVAAGLAGCRPLVADEGQPISVYATFYPIYALTEGVARDVPDLALHCLVQPQDGCLRSYQLSDWDVSLLAAGANAVVMGGRGLESFESTLFGWGESGPAMSAVLYNLELYNQDDKSEGDSEAEDHLRGANPHLYMSLKGAKEIVESISATLVTLDPGYAEQYVANARAAAGELDALLLQTREELRAYSGRRVALMNEALIYPALDYDLQVAGWIPRESGEAMVDDELAACVETLSGMEPDVVLIEAQAPRAFVRALEDAGFAVARLDVLSTHREGEGFDAYIDIMRGNAQAIREAFERADGGKDEH